MTVQSKQCATCGATWSMDVPDHGFLSRIMDVRRLCDPCGVREREQADQEYADRLAKSHAEQVERRQREAGLPVGLPAGLSSPDPEALEACREWADGRSRSLLLCGDVGTGKTTLAAMAFRRRLATWPGYWRSMPVLLAHLGLGFGNRQHDQALSLLDGRYMLGLDDIDKGRSSEYVGQHVFAAVDGGYASGAPLIVTSNLTLPEIGQRWEGVGDAVASRLSDGVVVEMRGNDRRLAVTA